MADKYERFEETVDPERRDERARAAAEARDRLRSRGVVVSDRDSADDLSRLIDAVEGFEAAVEKHGGDLMVDEPVNIGEKPEKPDSNLFALPTRGDDESISVDTARGNSAADAANQGPWS